jgi:hypothetical protein
MNPLPPPLTFFLLLFSGWINRHQQAVIDYLLEENRVLRAVNGSRGLRLTNDLSFAKTAPTHIGKTFSPGLCCGRCAFRITLNVS